MKSIATVSETTVFTACRPFVWAAMLSVIIASTQGLAQTPGQRPATIRGGLLFEHPLEAIAESPAGAQEASVLRVAISSADVNNALEVCEALEVFAAKNPASVWTPSLRANLGRRYCTEGRWTKALEQWERAWDDTRQHKTGAGKRVGDYTLANWTRLLVELGRLDELQVIFAEAEGRRLDGGPLSQKYLRTIEMYGVLRHRPEATYRCGWLVLNHLALATRGQGLDRRKVRDLYQERNLLQSCSMSVLLQIALSEQWAMVGVERPEGNHDLPIPSIMHLKQGHYIALLRDHGDFVLAYDPISGVRQFRRDVLNAETSGRFLLEAAPLPAGWRALSVDEMAATVGRSGGGFTFPDQEEGDCDPCACPGNAGPPPPPPPPARVPRIGHDGSARGMGDESIWQAFGSSCGDCGGQGSPAGMPRWRVTEPNINVWLQDQPLACQPAYGPAVALDLQFKQRDEELFDWDSLFSFGPSWNSHWLSHVYCLTRGFLQYGYATVYLPGGGVLNFSFALGETVATKYEYNCRLTATLANNQPTAFTLDFPDGRQYYYDRLWGSGSFYLSRAVDQQGFVTRYNYVEVENGTALHLDTVADQAGDTLFALQYTNGTVYANLVSVVTDRFGRTARLSYTEDESGYSHLTQIEDAAGLVSTVSYNDDGWPQTLATPYGSTTFEYDGGSGTNWSIYRRVRITEPNGGTQTYLFVNYTETLWGGQPWMPVELPASLVPDNLPEGTTLDTSLLDMNSLHWNQRQDFGVPAEVSQLTTNHMNKARMRHWLMKLNGDDYVPDFALAAEVAPSQSDDGSTLGQITFYDHAGKPSPGIKGTQVQPSLMARKLPDGSTWYTAYARNSFGLPTSETSTYGTDNPASTRTYTYTYAANGQDVVERRGPGNVLLATYGYNTRHQRTNEIVWPDSTTSYTNTWTYDAQGRLESKTTAAGQTTSYTHNGSSDGYSGYLSGTSEQPVQRTESFTWLNGLVRAHTDVRGLTVTNFWDGLNRLTGRLYPDGTTTTNLYTRAAAYPNGTGGLGILDVAATRDRLGNWTGFDYDALRRISARTNANGVVTRYGYCDCGSASYITNAWGTPVEQVTTFSYDNQGNRTLESYADGYSVTNWFNALGLATVSGDGTGYRWYFYNNQGLLTTISNACGLERVILFDVHDRPEYVVDANGVVVANTHDNLGRLLTRTYPDDGVEGFGYSARGLVAYTNQVGSITRYAYDEALRKTFETNANTEVVRFTNSAAGDLLSLTDGKNQTTRWSYDQYGRVTNKLDQASSVVLRYAYDAQSRLTNRWSAAKGNTGYGYDAAGNLTSINYPASTDVTLQYDWLNRLTNMVDAAGTTKYGYTAGNQLLSEDGPFASDTVTNLHVNRLRTALGLQQPTGQWTNSFGWDEAGRLSSVTSPAGTVDYTHTALYEGYAGRLVQQLGLPSGAFITNLYDPVARLLSTKLLNSQLSTLNSHQYGYNTGNQRTAYTNAAGTYVLYSYDAIGQLKVGTSSLSSENRGYAYEAAWNLNYLTNNGTTTTFSVDSRNQLTSAANTSETYDGNGNLTQEISSPGAINYSYDDENRLSMVVTNVNDNGTGGDSLQGAAGASPALVVGGPPPWKCEFVYDGLGRLRQRLEYINDTLQTTTRYIYDGRRVIQERNSANTPAVAYTRGADLSGSLEGAGGIGGLLARSSGYSGGNWTSHAYYHADGNGNITCLINSSQSLVASYRYDPFGNTISQSGSLSSANVYRFSSKEIVSHTNSVLYYYGYRFYDPGFHRWLNKDPLGAQSHQQGRFRGRSLVVEMDQGPNLFWPFRNEPISHHDKDGRIVIVPVIICCIAGGAVLTGCSHKPAPVYTPGPERAKKFSHCWQKVPPGGGKWTKGERLRACMSCCAIEFGDSPATEDPATDDFIACEMYCRYKFAGGL